MEQGALAVVGEFVWIMALFANLARRTQGFYMQRILVVLGDMGDDMTNIAQLAGELIANELALLYPDAKRLISEISE